MTKQYIKTFCLLFLAMLGMAQTAAAATAFRNFAVNLTDGTFATNVTNFGVKVEENGTYAATTADDATANFTVKAGRWNDPQHGWVNCVFTIPVEGPVLIKLGDCQFGAQTGTIVDTENNITELTKPAKQCWASSKPDENVVATYYRGLSPTTLTVTYNGYCPFISVTAVDPADLPAETPKATVSFAVGEATGAIVPASIEDEVGKEITLPKNYTMYVEGKTLTGWSDGNDTYAPGATYTVPAADITLQPVFTANEVSLADRTEPVTLKWNFRRDQGAPVVQWQGTNGNILVAQATIGDKTIDVPMTVNTSPGKFNNANNTDWAQTNIGTKFTIPACKGSVVSMEGYSEFSTTTIDGQNDYTSGKTISYTLAGNAETVDIVIGVKPTNDSKSDCEYTRYIQVVLPVVQSKNIQEKAIIDTDFQDWTKSSTTSEITTNFSKENITFTYVNTSVDPAAVNEKKFSTTTDPAYKGYIMCDKKEATVTTTAFNNITKIRYRHGATGSNRGWGLKVKGDGDNDWVLISDEKTSSPKWIEKEINRENVQLQWYNLNTAENAYMFELEIYANVEITAEQVSLTTAVSPEGAGSVSVYPISTEFDKGSTIKVTATENFGYDFVNWTNEAGTEVSTDPVYQFDITQNEKLTANFKAVNTYELKLTVDGTNDYMVTVSPAGTEVEGKQMYEEGTAVQLTANQYEGLVTFTNWSDGTTDASKLITMNDNVTLTANYSETDIIAGWDFYTAGNNGRKADFAAADNDADALNLVKTDDGTTSGWLDKSTLAAGGYEGLKGAAVNWRTGSKNGDVGYYHWQTKVNAEAFTNIKVQFQMVFNFNAYTVYDVEYSTDGTTWTKAGSTSTMARRQIENFSVTLPEACNNQKELYIRMIADKNSTVDNGAPSPNDGNALGMFFITGTPKLVDDPVAPALLSSVPENGATGASATGKIVLNFDKKVQVVEGTKATLGSMELTPAVSGKVITFSYKGLEYATEYTFTLPANTVKNLTGATLTEAITISFTTMARPSVTKGLYDKVVSTTDELVAAINAANSRADKNVRYRIFVKNGEYTIPLKSTMKTCNGYEVPECITFINTQNLSLIGESRDGVIITNGIDKNETFAGTYGTTSKYDGIGNSDVFQISGSDYYFQDLTIESCMDDGTGRDLAVQDKATRTIYKNTGLRGYQDTWTSNNDHGLYYFEGGYVRGRTDYMCGKGDAFFNGVELRQIYGGYAAVPSNSIKYGYVYKDCVINGESSPAVCKEVNGVRTPYTAAEVDGNYTLGRPWGKGTPVALFIDTKMNVVPSAIGWNEMSGGFPKRFAEWNSTTSTGSVIDLSTRKNTFDAYDERKEVIVDGQKTYEYTNRRDEANNPELNSEEALEAGNLHNMFGEWDPTLLTEQAPVPTNVKQNGNNLEWDDSQYALLWAVVKDGSIIDFTITNSYEMTEDGTYSVRAANEMGGLSEASAEVAATGVVNGIQTLKSDSEAPVMTGDIYTLQGIRVDKARKGLYIIGGRKVVIK